MKHGLSSFQLKLIALITMFIDHLGSRVFTKVLFFRIIGRMAFPLYAFLIGEGCRHTKNKKKYLFDVFITFIAMQLVRAVLLHSSHLCVLYGFMCAIVTTMLTDWAKDRNIRDKFFVLVIFGCMILSIIWLKTEYKLYSLVLPLIIYYVDNKYLRNILFMFVLVICRFSYRYTQWYGLLAMIPILLYNGQKGRTVNKYLFYAFYPIHYAILILIQRCLF